MKKDKNENINRYYSIIKKTFLSLSPSLSHSSLPLIPSFSYISFCPHSSLSFSLFAPPLKEWQLRPTVGRGTCKWLKGREEEKDWVARLIRFRELKVSIVTESVSVGGRRKGTISPSLFLSHFTFPIPLFSLHLFTFSDSFLPSSWGQITKLNYKLSTSCRNLTLALAQLSLK